MAFGIRIPALRLLHDHEEFCSEEAGRIAAIVRPPMLPDNRYNLGMAFHDFPRRV